MFPVRKKFHAMMREISLSNHLTHRSTQKSAPNKGLTTQPHTNQVEVHLYG